ncbi:UNVERIFIED_CONTAM: Vacuolar protein sorting-associated protein 53 A [Sesamum radiatum]|uniref:RING-type E3 ubiquitin transferase n=2 Tax=Pentapetalae TaxID=1437201 RepID=A0AAW2JVS3_SESRA
MWLPNAKGSSSPGKRGGRNGLVAVAIDKDKGSQYAIKWAIDNLLTRGQTVILIHVVLRSSTAACLHVNLLCFSVTSVVLRLPNRLHGHIHCFDVVLEDTDIAKAITEYTAHAAIENLVLGASRHGFIRLLHCLRHLKTKISSVRNASRLAPFTSPLLTQIQQTQEQTNNTTSSPDARPKNLPSIRAADRTPRKTGADDTDSLKSPYSRAQRFHANMFADLSETDSDISFVSSGRPSVDRAFADPMSGMLFDGIDPGRTSRISTSSESSFGSMRSGARFSELGSYNDFSSSSLENDDVEAEMRRLKLELQKTMEMYSTACKEALTAKQKAVELHRWRQDEEQRLEESRLAEEAARRTAEKEKAKYKAAMENAQAAQRVAELESRRRVDAEKKAIQEVDDKDETVGVMPFRYRRYSIDEIEEATEFFAISRKIGEGGYGPVFKCYLDHTRVAIKVLRPDAAQGRSQFQQEVEVLCCMRHPNIVLLLGACPEYGCLVYEYMANGSLEDRLVRKGNTRPLSWQLRFRIAAEIATGLHFLHQTKPEPLVHRDLKPGNILLDHNYVSKISDVGLARLVPPSLAEDVTQYRMTSTAGTFCYIDPEYQQSGMLGTKSDVYSLGIVLLQIITAKPAMGLTHYIEQAIEDGTLTDMLDPTVPDWPLDEAMTFAKLALQCAELRRRDRPDLGKIVVPELNKLRDLGEESMTSFLVGNYASASPNHGFASPLKGAMSDPHVASAYSTLNGCGSSASLPETLSDADSLRFRQIRSDVKLVTGSCLVTKPVRADRPIAAKYQLRKIATFLRASCGFGSRNSAIVGRGGRGASAEASLSGVEPLMQKIHSEVRRVDAEILAAVRQQSNSGSKAREDLAAATLAVQELIYKMQEIKNKAEQSETMVQEICRDIKKLDFAKKHITTTITALHRLTMLVSAVEQLQVMASKRQYKEAAAQLECYMIAIFVKEYGQQSSLYLKSPPGGGTGKESEETNLLQRLSDACLVVDALEPSVREELVKNFCSRELTSYHQIFEGAELAKLDKTERRYAWIKRRLRTNEEIWKIFPSSWHVPYLLCIQFCKLTRTQLVDILNNLKEKPDVGTLLLALQRTLEFEEELAEKFGGGSRSKESGTDIGEDMVDNNNQTVSDIRKKYEKKLAANHGSENEACMNLMPLEELHLLFNSSVQLGFHLDLTLKKTPLTLYSVDFYDLLGSSIFEEETWEIEEGSQTNVLSSSIQVFLIIRRSLKRCSALTKNQTLFNLFKVFQRILKAYATKLFARLPKGGTGIVAAATGMDGQIKTSDKDERLICYIVNTAEYCHKTSGELAENVSKIVDSQFADRIDMSEVQDEFSAVITKALITLVHGIETKFDIEMAAMTRVPWGTLESVGDQSEYVNGINTILTASIPVLGRLLSPIYFQFFLDKLASSLGPRFYLNIFKCKQISETGAQQMLLDTQAVKTILLEIPSLAKQTSAAAAYSKFVSREMSKAEALLKVILSPVDSVADTYCALLPEGTPGEFQRILDLKGLKRTDQQSILDDYNKRGAGTYQPSMKPVVPAAPNTTAAPVTANQSTPAGIIPLKEELVARAAALGRGAATTGIRRILALTESTTKDRKDGPLRKLFIG